MAKSARDVSALSAAGIETAPADLSVSASTPSPGVSIAVHSVFEVKTLSESEKSRVSTSVDFDKTGKQFGHLSIPHSRDDSAWGSLRMPIVVIKNGRGPTALFTGGNHGDEYEGPVSIMKLARELDPGEIQGRLILIPALNYPAVCSGKRTSPIDGGNMNRSFPGSRRGTITQMIAHYLHSELLPLCDVVADLHSGGKTLNFIPSAIMHQLDDKKRMQATLDALLAFGAPIGLVLRELDAEGMLDTAVEEMGKIFISTELGGGGSVTAETVRVADVGIRNLLRHFGLLDETVVSRETLGLEPTRLMHTPDGDCFVIAEDDGIYEVVAELGAEVEAGDVVGRIHNHHDPSRTPLELVAHRPGLLLCRHFPGLIKRGDCAAVVAEDYQRA